MLKLKRIEFACTDGEREFSVAADCNVRTDHLTLEIGQTEDGLRVGLHTDRDIVIRYVRAVYDCSYSPSEVIFLNGYQTWTDSTEHTIRDRMHGLNRIPRQLIQKYHFTQYGDYGFVDYPDKPGMLHGFSYGYIRQHTNYRFFGSLDENNGFTVFRTDTNTGTLTAERDCAGLHVHGDYLLLHLIFLEGREKTVFDGYFDRLGIRLREEAKPLYGYTSWYRHYQNISEEILLADLAGMQEQPYPVDVFQIDDGYQTAVGDWLSVNPEKFPNGMAGIASAIREAGFLPGIWLAPFAAEEQSELFQTHPDWFVQDEYGSPVSGGSNWSGFYALDICNEEVRSYLREVIRTITQDWGYRLLKLDFLYAACIQPRPGKTRGRLMAEAMDFLRECAGDAFLLGCGVPLASAFGKVDYCRIGCDVCLDWDDKPHMRLTHRERVSTRNAVLNAAFRRQLNGRAFLNDPDVFLLRSEGTSMTAVQRTCLAEVCALTGSVLFTSDNPTSYGEGQKSVLSRMMKLKNAEVLSVDYRSNLLRVTFR
ncbi:MAG: alpha-galactosidase, partial [Oscillospiraceae bacterium]|nr:alpha-galactosidase [Oscillospiraceae bacterium]